MFLCLGLKLWWWRKLLRVPWTARRPNQSILRVFGRSEAKAPILWPPDVKNWLTGKSRTHWKRPWCWERLKAGGEGDNKDEMVGWPHWLNGHEFEQAPGVGDGQGGLACCSPWGRKELETAEWLNWTELNTSYSGVSEHVNHVHLIFYFFKDFFFFDVDYFKSLYWLCYNIAPVLCFGFLATRHVRS